MYCIPLVVNNNSVKVCTEKPKHPPFTALIIYGKYGYYRVFFEVPYHKHKICQR